MSDRMVLGTPLRKDGLLVFFATGMFRRLPILSSSHEWPRQNVSPLVTGVGQACFSHYPTQAAALATFNEAVSAGAVEVL